MPAVDVMHENLISGACAFVEWAKQLGHPSDSLAEWLGELRVRDSFDGNVYKRSILCTAVDYHDWSSSSYHICKGFTINLRHLNFQSQLRLLSQAGRVPRIQGQEDAKQPPWSNIGLKQERHFAKMIYPEVVILTDTAPASQFFHRLQSAAAPSNSGIMNDKRQRAYVIW